MRPDCNYFLDGRKLTYEEFRKAIEADDDLIQKYTGLDVRGLRAAEESEGALAKRETTALASRRPSSPEAFRAIENFRQAQAADAHAYEVMKAAESQVSDRQFGEKVRTFYTGARDVRIAQANQTASQMRDELPNHLDREALSLYRDFKHRPGEMEQFLDGTHPYYAELPTAQRQAAVERVAKLGPAIQRALNPSPQLKQADEEMTDYFTHTLEEGRKFGFLESGLSNDEYIRHFFQPREAPEGAQSLPGAGRRMGPRYMQEAKKRAYPTILHAVAAGIRPRTIDAVDALTLYGDNFAKTASTHELIHALARGGMGAWGTPADKKGPDASIPWDWQELAPETHYFRNAVPVVINDTGKAAIMHQLYFVPRKIRDALRPVIEPNYLNRIPNWRRTQAGQAYLKGAELSLSAFHLKALALSGNANMGPDGLLTAMLSDMKDPAFEAVERALVRAGGTTSILGKTMEAYKGLQASSLPSRLDMIRSLPALRQVDATAKAITDYTFGVVQRKLKVTDFAIKSAKWLAKNPNATPSQAFEAQRQIAKELNAVYGGLHWENLGVHQMSVALARLAMLAPDWLFSNFANAYYAFQGGPGGNAARLFWLRGALYGLALTQGLSLLMSGEMSDDPTKVRLGKDHRGRIIHQNFAYAGAHGDLITAIQDFGKYGPLLGAAKFGAGKISPVARVVLDVLAERAAQGGSLRKPGDTAWDSTLNTFLEIVRGLSPIPLSVSTVGKMLLDDEEYTPQQYIGAVVNGRVPLPDKPEPPAWKAAAARAGAHRPHKAQAR